MSVAETNGRAAAAATGTGLEELVAAHREYLYLPNVDHIAFAAAVAVTAGMAGDPVWGQIVGAPSGAKTEAIRAHDGTADEAVDDLTVAGLLGWLGGPKNGRPIGLLSRLRIGEDSFVTIGDFSTLLDTTNTGARDTLYSMLRRAYDGSVTRELGSAPHPLHWDGRVTLLSAVTPAIDHFSSHADALGPRWLYCRLPDTDTASRKKAGHLARMSSRKLEEHRGRVREAAGRAVAVARGRLDDVEISDKLGDAIEDAALVVCLARAAVKRHGYGKREIDAMPIVEEPPRITAQLSQLAHALLALGCTEREALDLCRRVGLDSAPQVRRHALAALSSGWRLSTSAVAREAGAERQVTRRALEELAAVGIVEDDREDTDLEDPPMRGTRHWWLSGEDADLVGRVLRADLSVDRAFPR